MKFMNQPLPFIAKFAFALITVTILVYWFTLMHYYIDTSHVSYLAVRSRHFVLYHFSQTYLSFYTFIYFYLFSFFYQYFSLQRILEELKDVIESMRWASAEESRLKIREIDSLKEEIQRINAVREESLETQRRFSSLTFFLFSTFLLSISLLLFLLA